MLNSKKIYAIISYFLLFFILVIYNLLSSTYQSVDVLYSPCEINNLIDMRCKEIKKQIKFSDVCRPTIEADGIVTDPCFCNQTSWFELPVNVVKNVSRLEIKSCASIAGKDGTKGLIFTDDKLSVEISIPSNNCMNYDLNVGSGKHILRFQSSINGTCESEWVKWVYVRPII